MALRAPHNRVDPGHELVLVERLRQVIVGAEAEAPHLVLYSSEAGQHQHGRGNLAYAEVLQNVVSANVRQVEVQEDDVVVVELAKLSSLLAKVGGVDVKALSA